MTETPNLRLKIPEDDDAANTPYYMGEAFATIDAAITDKIIIIPKDTDIPIPDRIPGSWYFKVTDTQTTLPTGDTIKVSPNMGIKIPTSKSKRSKSGISFE